MPKKVLPHVVQVTEEDNVVLELRYATENNVTGAPFYKRAVCYMHVDAWERFQTAQALVAQRGCIFKIWDAYRPVEAQQFLLEATNFSEYVANPATSLCNHTAGIAIDLTIVDAQGKELDMGTDFDDFTTKAHQASTEISQVAQENRKWFRAVMEEAGFRGISIEWWHYQLPDNTGYERIPDKDLPISVVA